MPTTTTATRTRSFTDPHPIPSIQLDALVRRETFLTERKERIAQLVKDNDSHGDEFYWTMVYDLDEAPTTTGRAQLLVHGIVPVPPQDLIAYVDLHDELWTVIEALARESILLLNTDHLSDSDLYARLYYRILDEPCRQMPPSSMAVEYIDCLHPMDRDYPLGKAFVERGIVDPTGPSGDKYEQRGPICPHTGSLVDRDRWLPKAQL
jgi:hypothetical protein